MGVRRASTSVVGTDYRLASAGYAAVPLPSALSGLEVWLSADAETGYTNGDSVTTWTDLSGNSRDFTATNTIWKASATPTGNAAIAPNGAVDWAMTRSCFMSGSAGEIFIMMKAVNSGNNNLLDNWGTPTDQSHWTYSNTVYESFGSDVRHNDGGAIGGTWTPGNWYALSIYSAASDWGIYVGGTLGYSTTSNTVAWATVGSHRVGNGGGGSRHEIAELFAFSRKLSAGERANMFTYLTRHTA